MVVSPIVVILALHACGTTGRDPATTEAPACEFDSCAETPSEPDGLACCIDAHGYGIEDADNLERLATSCQAEECDAGRYLSAAAAVCIAQSCGLPLGIGSCYARFEFGSSGPRWAVDNETEICDDDHLCGGGDILRVQAETGACSEIGAWLN